VNQAERALFDRALLRARLSAYPTGEFVGQESFMSASEILCLAVRAGVRPGCSVLDLCCGVAGPGRLITRALGCAYLGVDACSAAVDIARDRARGLPCRFHVFQVPPVPGDGYDVVLLLETLLAFRDKEKLLREVSSALKVGSRFVFTMEEGQPLTELERAIMPDADTVWLTPMAEMLALLERAGLRIRWQADRSKAHRIVADSLIGTLTTNARHITTQLGSGAVDELLTSHRLWSRWLGCGRVRKFALIAEKIHAPV
jgi:SAM-dependent methyltransferase